MLGGSLLCPPYSCLPGRRDQVFFKRDLFAHVGVQVRLPPGCCLTAHFLPLQFYRRSRCWRAFEGTSCYKCLIWVTTIGNVNKNTSAEIWPCPRCTCSDLLQPNLGSGDGDFLKMPLLESSQDDRLMTKIISV